MTLFIILLPAIMPVIICIAQMMKTEYMRRLLKSEKGCEPVSQAGRAGSWLSRMVRQSGNIGDSKTGTSKTLSSANKYGSTFGIRLLGRTSIVTTDPSNVKALLATQFQDVNMGHRSEAMGPFLGDGIFTSDNGAWQASRDILRPVFKNAHKTCLQTLETHFQNLKKRLPEAGKVFNIGPIFQDLGLDLSTEFLFGESTSALLQSEDTPELVRKFGPAFDYGMKDSMVRFRVFMISTILRFFTRNNKAKQMAAIVHEYTDKQVAKAIKEYKSGPKEEFGAEQGRVTLLNELVKVTQDPKKVRGELLNVLSPARDSVATMLSWAMFIIARNPAVWQKIREEIAPLEGKAPTYDDLHNMAYLKNVVKEVLRLFPLIPSNGRFASHDTTLPHGGGEGNHAPVFVEKGTFVQYSCYAMQRNKGVYGDDAEEFRPERWESNTLRPGYNYIPFNAGPRICIGQQIALVQMYYVIVRLAQQYSELHSEDDRPIKAKVGLIYHNANGYNISLS